MRIPFLNRPETREGYTDAIIEFLLKRATGGSGRRRRPPWELRKPARDSGAGAFASAKVTPVNAATAALTPAVLEAIGRRLLLHGEAVFEIEVGDDVVRLVEASTWDIEERGTEGSDAWTYRADFSSPDRTYSRTLTADRILHPRIGVTSTRPWEGESPIPSATAKLAAVLETKLTQEIGGAVGGVLPLPHKGNMTKLQADIDSLDGRTVLVESTAGGYGDKESAPKGDWQKRRIGAEPPESLIGLRKDVQASILGACGCPGSLLERSDGTLAREEMRRFLHSTISPVARIAASEMAVKLDTPGLSFDFSELFASDLSGRARAFQSMVGGGMDVERAMAKAGLMVNDDDDLGITRRSSTA